MLTRARIGLLLVALVANLLFASTLSARNAHACSCAGPIPTPAEELRASDVVFSGEVVRTGVEDPDPQGNMQLGGVEFRVMEAWKGVTARSAVVYGQGESYYGAIQEGDIVVQNSCHYASFARGKSYLIYASRSDGYLNASVCSGTKPLANAEEDLLALGPPTVRLPETGGPIFSPDRIATGVAVFAALALASALIARRRRRGGPS